MLLIVFNYVSANEGVLWGGDGMVYLQCDNKWYVSGLLSNITGTEWFKNGGAVRFKMRRFWVDFFRHKKPVWPTICTTIKLISLSQLGVEGVRIHISSHDAKNFSTSFHSESHNILSLRETRSFSLSKFYSHRCRTGFMFRWWRKCRDILRNIGIARLCCRALC